MNMIFITFSPLMKYTFFASLLKECNYVYNNVTLLWTHRSVFTLIRDLSHDVASGSEETPCNKTNNPLVASGDLHLY